MKERNNNNKDTCPECFGSKVIFNGSEAVTCNLCDDNGEVPHDTLERYYPNEEL